MPSNELLYEYRWAIAVLLVGLLLLSRYIMRRMHERREARRRAAAESGETQLVSPEGYRRARKQFLVTLFLLIVIVAASVLTHFT
jgi:hypothetical protein